MSPTEMAATDDQSCSSYGFKPGTNDFAQCRLSLAEGHHIDDVRQNDHIREGLRNLSRNMAATTPRTCNANTFGSQTTMTCF